MTEHEPDCFGGQSPTARAVKSTFPEFYSDFTYVSWRRSRKRDQVSARARAAKQRCDNHGFLVPSCRCGQLNPVTRQNDKSFSHMLQMRPAHFSFSQFSISDLQTKPASRLSPLKASTVCIFHLFPESTRLKFRLVNIDVTGERLKLKANPDGQQQTTLRTGARGASGNIGESDDVTPRIIDL